METLDKVVVVTCWLYSSVPSVCQGKTFLFSTSVVPLNESRDVWGGSARLFLTN